eukprot:GHVU01029308.1.p1 GENE.GHVU01029308.1~~GHVU01029308.1.p1  ORF type:complete len:231 (+),score=11.58 GHVU01029308.1:350-1042(+)
MKLLNSEGGAGSTNARPHVLAGRSSQLSEHPPSCTVCKFGENAEEYGLVLFASQVYLSTIGAKVGCNHQRSGDSSCFPAVRSSLLHRDVGRLSGTAPTLLVSRPSSACCDPSTGPRGLPASPCRGLRVETCVQAVFPLHLHNRHRHAPVETSSSLFNSSPSCTRGLEDVCGRPPVLGARIDALASPAPVARSGAVSSPRPFSPTAVLQPRRLVPQPARHVPNSNPVQRLE